MRKKILTAAFLCAFVGTRAQEFYEKHVAFPAGAAYTATAGVATNGVHLFPSFRYQYLYRP